MDNNERIKMAEAMNYIARHISDERVRACWDECSVSDGGRGYIDIPAYLTRADYTDNTAFSDLMDTFLYCMKHAHRRGGIYCDGVISLMGE